MRYEFELGYEIGCCQECPLSRREGFSTRCCLGDGEKLSIRYGSCPLKKVTTGLHIDEVIQRLRFVCDELEKCEDFPLMMEVGNCIDFLEKEK